MTNTDPLDQPTPITETPPDDWADATANTEPEPVGPWEQCEAPATLCVLNHDHQPPRPIGDDTPGGIYRELSSHDYETFGINAKAAQATRDHLIAGHDANPTGHADNDAELHRHLHDIDDDRAKAFRSPASFGAVLAGLVRGDWLDVADEMTELAIARGAGGDLTEVTALLYTVEKARKALQLTEDAIKAELSTLMRRDLNQRQTVVPGFGTLEAKAGAKRKDWDTDRVVSAITAVGISGYVDQSTGEVTNAEGVMGYANGVANLLAACTPSWRVGGLAALGLNADDYCSTEYGRATVIARWAN